MFCFYLSDKKGFDFIYAEWLFFIRSALSHLHVQVIDTRMHLTGNVYWEFGSWGAK